MQGTEELEKGERERAGAGGRNLIKKLACSIRAPRRRFRTRARIGKPGIQLGPST